MNAHTPTPWHTGEGKAARIVYAQHGFAVADATIYHARIEPVMEAEENAAFIVHACNAHDELVAALRDIEHIFDGQEDCDDGVANDAMRAMTIIQAALAKAVA